MWISVISSTGETGSRTRTRRAARLEMGHELAQGVEGQGSSSNRRVALTIERAEPACNLSGYKYGDRRWIVAETRMMQAVKDTLLPHGRYLVTSGRCASRDFR